MRALRCNELGPATSLVVENIADPKPASGEVVIDIYAAGLNFPERW